MQSFKNGIEKLEETLGLGDTSGAGGSRLSEAREAAKLSMAKHLKVTAASAACHAVARAYAADEARRDELRLAERTAAFDAAGNYLRKGPDPQVMRARLRR
jgi:hypothetical protein